MKEKENKEGKIKRITRCGTLLNNTFYSAVVVHSVVRVCVTIVFHPIEGDAEGKEVSGVPWRKVCLLCDGSLGSIDRGKREEEYNWYVWICN